MILKSQEENKELLKLVERIVGIEEMRLKAKEIAETIGDAVKIGK